MLSESLITSVVNGLVVFATDLLLPAMVFFFMLGVVFRFLVYFTVKRQQWFFRHFETRVFRYFEDNSNTYYDSFYLTMKKILEKTFYEVFVLRSIMKRRNPDFIMDLSDRVFLIRLGSAKLIKDLMHVMKFWKYESHEPKFEETTSHVIQRNPCFSKVFGIIPVGSINDVLNILPGMFIVAGIFGTFLGIMKALPELGNMDLTDIEGTKAVMDTFLLKISFSMSTSIIGIVLNIAMTMINTLMNPEKEFVDAIIKMTRTMELVWNSCSNNKVPADIPEFDENRDSLEVMAQESVQKDVDKFENSKINQILNSGPKALGGVSTPSDRRGKLNSEVPSSLPEAPPLLSEQNDDEEAA